jgi:hypothetical protein
MQQGRGEYDDPRSSRDVPGQPGWPELSTILITVLIASKGGANGRDLA